ncbi:carbohydrate porin [Methylicorpusculum sp.]|uniref:carbohydrate porin n=1 Tax=Methylicorpusculum sp. TaxID=2713644 RepID=UPI0027317543|nr:carbohydrate porin [Methylicorpusculum sp.]MDP2178143.1 carbohydrate porin [Methylicorpusculum sp.]MDP3531060.1 carbohydrate porin [Methylicorpusculum sp.]MDZ4154256.1 carbohydrate porin [Methylicorpusculum sp.]
MMEADSLSMNVQYNNKLKRASLSLLGSMVLTGLTSTANALGPVEVPETWGGDLAYRQRLTGDWGGVRDEMSKKGVILDANMTLLPGGIATGGSETDAEFWGNVDYSLHLDTDKMGLWPGGFFKFQGVSSFGNTLQSQSGAFIPTNVASLYPEFYEASSGLMQASYTQFLSHQFGVTMGKLNLFDFTPTEFYGDYHTQFMNAGLNLSLANALVPMSAYGGGVLILPTKDITLMALALDASGTPSENDIGKAFDDGVTLVSGLNVKIKPFGLVGHQGVSGVWSDKPRFSLVQDPDNFRRAVLNERYPILGNPGPVLERIIKKFYPEVLIPVEPANRKDNTWSVIYSFDQYFWHPDGDPKRGIGFFFSFGATDGNPNPIQYSYMMGIGGKGVFTGRQHDSFGIGWARAEFSDKFLPILRERLGLGLDHEDAIELYYTAAITPWLNVSPNLQIINSALNKTLDDNGRLQDMDTAVEASLRMNIKF